MNICGYESTDFINGEGVRTSLWVSGCSHKCKGCFNQKAWSYRYGKEFTDEDMESLKKDLSRNFISGLSIMGGEPLDPENIDVVKRIIKEVKSCFGESKDIMVWTGYLFEDLDEEIKKHVDLIMDGKYDENKPTTKRFRGSDNQRLWKKVNGYWSTEDEGG